MSLILRRLGFVVSEAARVADAAALLEQSATAGRPPDWILLDLMLPDGTGVDVIRLAHARSLPSRICIITGCAADRLGEARDAGIEHIFTKPLDVNGLMSLMTA